MTAAQARILGEISGLMRSIADSLPPGEDITMDTTFIDDLEMNSLQMANLTGRIATFYGFKADLVPFYAARAAGPFHGLRVGELVDHLAGLLDDGEAAAVPGRLGAECDGTGQDEDAVRRLGRLAPVAGRHRPGSDNAAVLSEHAPGADRSLVRLVDGEVEAFTAGDGPGIAVTQPAEAARGTATAEMPETAPPPGPCSIVINSGRCGSTLLSRLIAEEPETLSASESLGPIRDRLPRQNTDEITGARYWAIVSDRGNRLPPLRSLGITPEEFCYPDNGRYAGDLTAVPPILRVTLPFLSADPDGLFDQLAERVPHFPRQPVLQHHKMMLNLLTNLTGRRRWVERSGASSLVARPLLRAFPEAKIVYLTRNIADTARSMSRHPAFQLGQVRQWFWVQYGTDPWTPGGQDALPDAAEIPEEMRRLIPGRITREALTDVMTRQISRFEALTSHMHGSAEQALADMKPRHLHLLRYEDLVARPLDELTKLGEFLGFADPSRWAARTANQVSRSPRTRSAQPA
jgi:putative sulfotransferase